MQAKLSITRACQICGLSRAAYYKRPMPTSERDAEVIDALNTLVTRHSRWGFWKCFTRLRLDGRGWNKKRVHRVYCDMGLNLPRRCKKRLPERLPQPLDLAAEPNRCWALDFMHDALYCGRPFRTLNVIDEANRECLAIEVGTSITSARLIRVLSRLVDCYGVPQAIRMDNVLNARSDQQRGNKNPGAIENVALRLKEHAMPSSSFRFKWAGQLTIVETRSDG